MVHCPKCNATLPDGAFQCQFCGTAFAAAPPGAHRSPGYTQPGSRGGAMPGAPRWVLPAYYFIAGWWLLDGIIVITTTLLDKNGVGLAGSVGILVGAINAVVGLGLILRIDLVRGIVNILCWIDIVFGAIGLIMLLPLMGILGLMGVLMLILGIIRVGFASLMIYLIGETDTHAPNI